MTMTDVDQIARTLTSLPDVLRALLTPFDHQALSTRPEEGEWCPLEVIGHLIACDSAAFRDRITGIVGGSAEIASFDAWEAINRRNFAAESLDDLLDELAAERVTSAALVRGLSPEDLVSSARFHDGREFQASDFVHEWPFHDEDHVQQILAALKLTHLRSMTPTMRGALTDSV